jgi:hypothetical protein
VQDENLRKPDGEAFSHYEQVEWRAALDHRLERLQARAARDEERSP